jgi:hypothetical protein
LIRQLFADKNSLILSFRVNGPRGLVRTTGFAFPIPEDKNTKYFSNLQQKKPPCTLGGKNVFFQGSTNGTVLKGFGLLIVFQRFGSDKLDINWFHFRNWISFVADTKMRKTTSGTKIFRPTIVFARRKSKIPDERCEDNKSISPLFDLTPRSI